MSVLVKGMEMPECCAYCSFAYDCFLCTATGNEFIYRSEEEGGYIDFTETRMPDCPLIEIPPHGRLIDEEVVLDHFVSLSNNEWNQNVITSWANAFAEAASDICDIPTVIPADKDGEA